MRARILLSSVILIMSVVQNACLVEQIIASIAEAMPQGDHVQSQHHEQAAPSHSHDEEGHEDEFCCDNEFYLYIGSHTIIHFNKVTQPNDFFSLSIDASKVKSYFQFRSYLHRLRQPTAMRSRDKYALTSLLHAPPSI